MASISETPQPTEEMLPSARGHLMHKFISRAIAGYQSVEVGSREQYIFVVFGRPDNPYRKFEFGYYIDHTNYNVTLTAQYPVEKRDGKEFINKSRRQVVLEVNKLDGEHDSTESTVVSKFVARTTYSYGDRFGNGPPYLEAFGPIDGEAIYGSTNTNDIKQNLEGIEAEFFAHIFQNEHMSPEATGAITFGLQDEIDARLRMTPEYVDSVLTKAETDLMKSSSNPNVMENTFVIGDQRITVSKMLQGVGEDSERVGTERLFVIDIEDLDLDNHNLKPKGTTRIQISSAYSFVADFKTGKLVISDLQHHDGSVIVLKDGELHMIDDSNPESYEELRAMIPFLSNASEADPFGYLYPQSKVETTVE